MSNNINDLSDMAAQALVAAGVASVGCDQRLHITDNTHEPVATAIDKDGEPVCFNALTRQIRQSDKAPRVARQSLKMARVEDLSLFVGRFKLPGTVIFAVKPDLSAPQQTVTGFTAVIDYSENSQQLGWNRHRAFVPC
jgi:hypothetical protein